MKIKIMRGIPGSGKSTYAKKLYQDAKDLEYLPAIVSADDFFVGSEGYKFDPANLGAAHKLCMQNFLNYAWDKMDLIIVDNTNINVEEVAPYVAVGEALDYDVEIIQLDTPAEIAAPRNIHGCPQSKVFAMNSRLYYANLPGRWKITRVKP